MDWLGPWTGCINEHHERYDGNGYPRRLAGDEISLGGRIIAVADAFETMTANRAYKKQLSVSAARKELTDCAGTHFDPAVVRAFTEISLPRLRRRTLAAGIFVNVPMLGPALSAVGQLIGLTGPAGGSALATLAAAAPTSAAAATVLATGIAVGLVPGAAASGSAGRTVTSTVTAARQGATETGATSQPHAALQRVRATAASHRIATRTQTVIPTSQPPVVHGSATSAEPAPATAAPVSTPGIPTLPAALPTLPAAASIPIGGILKPVQTTLTPIVDGAQEAVTEVTGSAAAAVNSAIGKLPVK